MNNKTGGAAAARLNSNSAWRFVEAFIREPLSVGSFWPSSPELARAVADHCDFKPGDTVAELGPGTGSFTELLLQRLHGRGRLLAMELSETNIAELRRRFPHCETIHDTAENLPHHLNGTRAKCVVSGLAWGNMLPAMQDRIFNAMLESLTPDGQFVAFAYVHAGWFPTTLRFRKLMSGRFARVERTPIIWRNLPPAFVYRCWRS
ncbi:MAG: methyltransferase domain-containing protein [Pedosphaera sp.]|nr:methyltransferase domain-containing protein [Pedosphaera sp.]